jgi:S1-C subfamily serine protease
LGSGFVIDLAGDIVTNQHVIGDADTLMVHLPDGTVAKARLLGSDPSSDLAVVKVAVAARHLHPLRLGAAGSLALGAPVLAIGSPFGYAGSVSAGIVSAFDREIQSPNGYVLSDAIQTDAAVNHGSSGGPLIDAGGGVVGVNTQLAISGVDGNVGVAFAIPLDAGTRKAIGELRTTGRISRAWLGIAGATLDAQLAAAIALPGVRGVLITGIAPGSPAARAGLEAGSTFVKLDTRSFCAGGDVLTSIGGVRIDGAAAMQNALERFEPGATVTIGVVHVDGVPATRRVSSARSLRPDPRSPPTAERGGTARAALLMPNREGPPWSSRRLASARCRISPSIV